MNKDLRVLVTGVKGQLGYECVRELKERGYVAILGIDIEDLDITNQEEVDKFIDNFKPDVIMHPAGWTAVDKAEEFPEKVFKVNAEGAGYLATAAQRHNAKMIYISTDYVFNGKGETPFEVDSPRDGLSVYGRSKSMGEDYVREFCKKSFVIRISWAFGINGNNYIKTMLKLAETHDELNIVCDQIGSPTYMKDLSKLMCDMMETEKYGVYHATNEGYCSWYEFTKFIYETAGITNVNVKPITTAEYQKLVPAQANRPLNSRMSKRSLDEAGFKRLPTWQDATIRFIKELRNED